MEKSLAALMLTLTISVMAIPAAYLVGQRSAYVSLQRQFEDELARSRATLANSEAATPSPEAPGTETGAIASEAVAQEPAADIEAATSEPIRIAAAAQSEAALPISTAPSMETSPPIAAESSPAEIPAAPIPQAVFEAAAVGASYEQIVREFGREGEPMMMLEDGDGTITTQYVWDWLDTEGNASRIRIQFVDGRLSDKTMTE